MKIIFFLIACIFAAQSASAEELRLGVVIESTGPNAQNGELCRQGIEVANKLIAPEGKLGSRELKIIYGDSHGDGKTGVTEFRRLVETEKAVGTIVQRSQVGMPINPLSKQLGIPMLGIIGHPQFIAQNPFALRAFPSTKDEGARLAEIAHQLGLRTVATISMQDEWTLAFKKDFEDEFTARGGKVVRSETVLPDEAEFSTVVTKTRAASPDVVLVNLDIPKSGQIIRRLREQGFKGQIVTNFWGAYPQALEVAGKENAEGNRTEEVNYAQPKFTAAHQALYPNGKASSMTYYCYAAESLLLQAAATIEGSVTSSKLKTALDQISGVELADETIPLVNREIRFPLVERTVKDGVPITIP